ncbi:hypothetical protein [Streptomyces sp. NBC_01716]|uniref:hypothetical protein n=1 Tax=Streptomyces sp. NBC_01716 TaxID=2975917 RepID=UPI002E3688EF|nr:hypothetical protein [Streptomyces sp. NBC_01716]
MDFQMPINGHTVEGPLAEWNHPDARWTEEFGIALGRAEADRAPVACPACGEPALGMAMDSIYTEWHNGQGGGSRVELGRLITLDPCGHTIAAEARPVVGARR